MPVNITMRFELDDDEYDEFMDKEEVNGDLMQWMFAELCQNHGFGFITDLSVDHVDTGEEE